MPPLLPLPPSFRWQINLPVKCINLVRGATGHVFSANDAISHFSPEIDPKRRRSPGGPHRNGRQRKRLTVLFLSICEPALLTVNLWSSLRQHDRRRCPFDQVCDVMSASCMNGSSVHLYLRFEPTCFCYLLVKKEATCSRPEELKSLGEGEEEKEQDNVCCMDIEIS